MTSPTAPVQAHRARQVVVLRNRGGSAHGHEAITLDAMGRRIASLMGCEYAGEYAPSAPYDATPRRTPTSVR